ncbi:MAG TPA: prepilin-type N-terminal cleavage/methylation domain-containing protein [Planctomycetota bacterium]|nr:prepilin-type N-terminal cleavage/methylation domain-containing protein [Planctomycetota bacterium]
MPSEPTALGQPATRCSEAGFSLVELMIATVVMVIGLVGIMNSCVHLNALQRLDAEVALSYRACLRNLEAVRAMPMATIATMNGTGFDIPGANGATRALVPQKGDPDGLPGSITVQRLALDAGRSLYRITATAKWHGSSGNSAVELMTMVGGMQ